MKKIIIILIFTVISQAGFSQLRIGAVGSYGVSVGKSEAVLLGNDIGRRTMEVAFLEHKSTPSIGISLTKDFGNLFFTGEVHYRKSAFSMRIQNFQDIDEPMSYFEEESNVIHLPVTGGLKFGNLRLGVGPVFNFQTSQSKGNFQIHNIDERKRNLQMGLQVGVGYDLNNHIRVGVKYENAFSKIGDDYDYRGKRLPINSKLDFVTFNVGFYF